MDRIGNYLAPDHRRCDDYFSAAEEAALQSEWEAAAAQFNQFLIAMKHHFDKEETVLFPAFEQSTHLTAGPTEVMRMEHTQMRELFQDMQQALASRDANAFAGTAETLLILMQQHNLKEEQMLYRMCDQMLARESGNLIERMNAVAP
ncbi:MAG: hemerythrin domain-containing protein [Hydrogenophilales bacterium]|nr:hemerythrin domain-containing protein [Hydrogenophilales bacterium]